MRFWFPRTDKARQAALPQDKPVLVDRLEGRIYFAHLGHEVFLPDAAAHGAQGLETAIDAPANHRRGRLFIPASS